MALLNDKQSNIVFIVVGLIALFLIFKIFRGVGLIKSVEEERQTKNAGLLLNVDWLKPEFYKKQVAEAKRRGAFKAEKYFPNLPHFKDYAKRIWDSKGFFKDNESQAIGVMKSFVSKSEASLFADYFNKTYQRDLSTFMETYMNDLQLSIIFDTIKPLRNI